MWKFVFKVRENINDCNLSVFIPRRMIGEFSRGNERSETGRKVSSKSGVDKRKAGDLIRVFST